MPIIGVYYWLIYYWPSRGSTYIVTLFVKSCTVLVTNVFFFFSEQLCKKGKRKVQVVPQSQTAAHPRHQKEKETDKAKQAQIKQTHEKHHD